MFTISWGAWRYKMQFCWRKRYTKLEGAVWKVIYFSKMPSSETALKRKKTLKQKVEMVLQEGQLLYDAYTRLMWQAYVWSWSAEMNVHCTTVVFNVDDSEGVYFCKLVLAFMLYSWSNLHPALFDSLSAKKKKKKLTWYMNEIMFHIFPHIYIIFF